MIALLYGLVVGAALGLTGGGGSIFAIPLLVYGLGLPMPQATGLSLAAVGLMAGFGAAVQRRNLEWRAGLVFAAAGMLLAPVGAALGHALPPALVLSAFALPSSSTLAHRSASVSTRMVGSGEASSAWSWATSAAIVSMGRSPSISRECPWRSCR